MKQKMNLILGLSVFVVSLVVMYKTILYVQAFNDNEEKAEIEKINNFKTESLTEKKEIKGKYIEADLQNMQINLIENNKVVNSFKIVSKGKPQSYYETPAGEFTIKSKDKDRYSTLGDVYMPYAMQFYGNFFIHGIPYYQSGDKVSSNYSGGCIRIDDENMKKIYEFSVIGTTLIVENNTTKYYSDKEIDNNTINSMMTILVSLETIDQEKYIEYAGKTLKFKDLNYYIAKGDQKAKDMVTNYLGKNTYNYYMNEKLISLGLNSLNSKKEKDDFVSYIIGNKNYVLNYFN
ncbi:MAG: hypothetical protein QG614_378 [Patescibacteria group bacterium]|nr:hypothetical protein [Patescibacteria group bacterium]